ncbi:MAG: hypothetical protein K2I08_04845, partial [Muribaculaceae bacterium]|nr:hypothetical protein [Muribaculaceae bacterium]
MKISIIKLAQLIISISIFFELFLTSCNTGIENQEIFAECNHKTFIKPMVFSNSFAVEDINENSPCSLITLEKKFSDEYSSFARCYSMYPNEKGYLTGICTPNWSYCDVKYCICWPNTTVVSFDKSGKITYISDDCKLIGQTDAIPEQTRYVDINMYDFMFETKLNPKNETTPTAISFDVTVSDFEDE